MNIEPLNDVLIIRPHKEVSSAGGILIPRTADEFHEDIGTVCFAGPGALDDNGKRIPMQVKVGDRVLFSTNGHQVTKVNGEELVVLRQNSVIGIVRPELAAVA